MKPNVSVILFLLSVIAMTPFKGIAEEAKFGTFLDAMATLTNAASSVSVKDAAQGYMEKDISDPLLPVRIFARCLTFYMDHMAKANRADRTMEFLEKLTQMSLKPDSANIAFCTLSDRNFTLQRYDQAIKVRTQLLEKYRSSLRASQVAAAVRYIALIQTTTLAQTNEALAFLDQEIAMTASNDVAARAEWLYQIAQIHADLLKDPVKANETYNKIVQMGGGVPVAFLADSYFKLAQTQQNAGNSKEAVALILECMKKTGPTAQTASIQKLLDYGASSNEMNAALAILYEKITPDDHHGHAAHLPAKLHY